MGITVEELAVKVGADLSDFKAAIGTIQGDLDKLQQNTKSISFMEAGEQLRDIGSSMTQSVTVPVLGFFQDAIGAASDANEEMSKFAQVFKGDLGQQGESWVSQTAAEMGRAESMVRSYAASFGAVLSPQFGENKKAALDLSEGYTKLAVDLSSFYNVTEDEAKQSLMSALAGETEPMRRFGVMLDETKVKAELLAMGVDTTTRAATDAEKQQARYNLIMKATADAQGDAVRTSDGFANSMRAIEGTFEQVKVELGNVLMPVIMQLVGALKTALEWFQNMDPGIKVAIVAIAGLAAAIGPLLVVFGTLLSSVGAVMGVLGGAGLGGALGGLVATVGPVVLVVGTLAAAFALMYTQSESFRAGLGLIVEAVVGLGKSVVEWVEPIVALIMERLMPIMTEWGNFFGEQIQKVADWVNGDGKTFMTFLGQVADAIQTGLLVALDTLFDVYEAYLQPALEWLISTALDRVLDGLESIGDWFASPSVQSAMRTIAEYLGEVWEWLEKLFSSGDALAKLLKGDVQGAMDSWKTVIGKTSETLNREMIPALDDARIKAGDLKTAAENAKTPLDNLAGSAQGNATAFSNANTSAGNFLRTLQEINATPAVPTVQYTAPIGPLPGGGDLPSSVNPTTTPATTTPANQQWPSRTSGNPGVTPNAPNAPDVEFDPTYTGPQMVKHADGLTYWHYPDGRQVLIASTQRTSTGSFSDRQKTGGINAYRTGETTLIINNPKGETPSQTYRNVRQQQRRLGAAAGVL